jgi:hypothetical protein
VPEASAASHPTKRPDFAQQLCVFTILKPSGYKTQSRV